MLLIGCGDIGSIIGQNLRMMGVPALGLRRNIDRLPAGLPGLTFDYASDDMSQLARWDGELALMTPTPAAYNEEGYRSGFVTPVQRFLRACAGQRKKLVYVSSTRVYGDHQGAWIDENTVPQPKGFAGELLLEAEELLRQSPHQITIVRPGGIYGKLPSRLLERVKRGELRASQPVIFGNRIHRRDCVGFVQYLLEKLLAGKTLESLYLAVDDAAVPQFELEQWLARAVGAEAVAEYTSPREEANKRCRNTQLHRSGYRLQYSDYRAGYGEMLTRAGMTAPP